MLTAQFNITLFAFDPSEPPSEPSDFDPACDPLSEPLSSTSPSLLAELFPGACAPEDSLSGRVQLGFRTAATMVMACALPLGASGLLQGATAADEWVPLDLVADFAIFSPIAVIFIYQHRQLSIIAEPSRNWRFVIGTFIGCVWALWTAAVFGQHGVCIAASCMLAAGVGTFVHATPYFGYAGLVMAFTTPLIALGQYWAHGHERVEQRCAQPRAAHCICVSPSAQ